MINKGVCDGGKRVSHRCAAALLTFLDELAPRLTERESASAPSRQSPATTPTQGPSLTSDTKWRPRRSHMTPLYSQTRRMHKYAGKNDPICPTPMHRVPLWPKHAHRSAYTAATGRVRRVSTEKIGGHFVKACAEKKRDASDRLKIKK